MIRRVSRKVIPLLAMMSASAAAAPSQQPYEAIRALRAMHERIAHGDADAHAGQRKMLAEMAATIATAAAEAWKEPANGRALVAFALSGGDPRVVRGVLGRTTLTGVDERLVKGALAYGEGRAGEAAQLLLDIDARGLDASLAGHVALVQSMLVGKEDRKRAATLLDDARLLAPGTLIEESALRRLMGLLPALGDFDRYEQIASQYFRRFSTSVYAEEPRRQFIAEVSRGKYATVPARWTRLMNVIEGWPPGLRKELCLALAEEGIIAGKLPLVRAVAAEAARMSADGADKPDGARSKVYEAAALIVTDEYPRGLELLKAIDRTQLGQSDAELLDAARDIAKQVRRLPEAGERADGVSTIGERARKTISSVDEILRGGAR